MAKKKKCQAKAKEAKASLANYKIKKSFSAIMETKYRQAKRVSKQRNV